MADNQDPRFAPAAAFKTRLTDTAAWRVPTEERKRWHFGIAEVIQSYVDKAVPYTLGREPTEQENHDIPGDVAVECIAVGLLYMLACIGPAATTQKLLDLAQLIEVDDEGRDAIIEVIREQWQQAEAEYAMAKAEQASGGAGHA